MRRRDKKIADFLDRLSQENKATPFASEEERQQAQQRLLSGIMARAEAPAPRTGRIISMVRMAVAAATLLLLAGITWLWQQRSVNAPATLTWISTGAREQKRVMLPDSSIIILNAGTRLSYSTAFNKKDRVVTLYQGEAFFDVHTNATIPFRVLTDSISTTVLGTSFNVMKYARAHTVRITVKTGKVQIGTTSKVLGNLLPADMMLVNAQTGHFTSSHDEGLQGDEWTSGRIIMREEPLSAILERLEMIYGVTFDRHSLPDDSLRTITFNASMPLPQVLTIVETISSVRFGKKDDQNKIHVYVK
ncbi:FecR family protein [Chitinophaga eiseniae]|uniref:Ferric-dicitrate binding protein FerR, regulates iron transport through sigma-19 n=1 Tax=Chitinophaga eiseniae TaxID=634771 RepID=A0A847SSW6_9BACT|nr:FecR family protein [Chitinophaga eiseniae]NLR80539.1 hypothetical protein [Chitinophaga eiseniae]